MVALLKQYGVLPAKATTLVAHYGHEVVTDVVEYLATNALGGKRRNVENPAGLIIYSLEKDLPVPAGFMSSRKRRAAEQLRRAAEEASSAQALADARYFEEKLAYEEWIEKEQDRLIKEQFTPQEQEVDNRLLNMIGRLSRDDNRFSRMTPKARTETARRLLRKELSEGTKLPYYEQWRTVSSQTSLFGPVPSLMLSVTSVGSIM